MKKSWHTATLRNIEKVWKLETQAEEEAKKLLILKKEKEKERALADFRKLHEEQLQQSSGGIFKEHRMDWMHGGGGGSTQAMNLQEEYLLGKRKATDILDEPSHKEANFKGIQAVLTGGGGAPLGTLPTFLEAGSMKDLESKFREDPLFKIKLKEQKEIQNILHAKLLAKRTSRDSSNSKLNTDIRSDPSLARTSARMSETPIRPDNFNRRPSSPNGQRCGSSSFQRGSGSRDPNKKSYSFTEEERLARLSEMQQSAVMHIEQRSKKVVSEELFERREKEQFQKDYQAKDLSRNFISETQSKVYSVGFSTNHRPNKDLAGELRARRAYLQKDKD